MAHQHHLNTTLKQHHIAMISIGGVIGAGVFVASGRMIALAGPAALLSYVMAALLVTVITRMLGEMAVAWPDTGSFSVYAERAIGPWAGFTIGWLYWWTWVMVLPLEANIAGLILHAWFPSIPIWIMVLSITLFLMGTNLVSVKHYGEFEFWFALIKVVAIMAFLGFGITAIVGLWPLGQLKGVTDIPHQGGFMPNGFGSVLLAMFSTLFAFIGTEIATVAAAESKNPAKEIATASRSVMRRIFTLNIGSMMVIVLLIPWYDQNLIKIGPFRYILELMDIPYAAFIMDGIILSAVLSCFNSSLYTASRMLFSLGKRHYAPACTQYIAPNGSPQVAVVGSTIVGLLAVIANYTAPEAIFGFLMSTTGATTLFMYLVIAVSQLRIRPQLEASGKVIALKTWGYPALTWATIIFIVAIILMMLFEETTRSAVAQTTLLGIAIVLLSFWVQSRHANQRYINKSSDKVK